MSEFFRYFDYKFLNRRHVCLCVDVGCPCISKSLVIEGGSQNQPQSPVLYSLEFKIMTFGH